MAIAKLKLVEIEFPKSQSSVILSKLINRDDFHPEPASKFADRVRGLTTLKNASHFADLLSRMEEAKQTCGFKYEEAAPAFMSIAEADQAFLEVADQVTKINMLKKDLEEMIEENELTIKQLTPMANDDAMDFDNIFTSKYLEVRYGQMPVHNVDKLSFYDNQIFLFKSFYKDAHTCYCFYVTTHEKAPEVDNIFSSLFFERIHIPDYVHGTPKKAIESLQEEIDLARKNIDKYEKYKQQLIESHQEELSVIYATCKDRASTSEAEKFVVVFGNMAAIYGFCEKKVAKLLTSELAGYEKVTVNIKPAMGDSRLTPPTLLKNNWFSKPFRLFVEMYGVPSYTDFDPTNFVAITYTLLFGIMFGDVGQGLVLAIVGFLFAKLKGIKLGEVGMRIGLSSIIFGFFFGSVFGNEEVLTFMPHFVPMESKNTMPLLEAAIGIGVVLIIISMMFNTYLNLKKKHWGEFFFSQNGVSGLSFYISIIILALNSLMGLHLPLGLPFILIFTILPILLIFLKEPLSRKIEGFKMFPEGFGSFFTEGFFELFDIVLTFITNTMSFLRVGGFVLSHAGMMLVVYTLANKMGGPGYWITLVIGNIFVMVLEGMIVGIQVLRLEFYEMFSRYYEGNGIPFTSIKDILKK